MTIARFLAPLALLGALVGCSDADRFAVQPPAVTETVRIAFRSVEVRDVSLPTYAASDEIALQSEDGTVTSSSDVLWADEPERAVALEVSRNLMRITGARIASEPWPFEAYPDARLELRFADMVASTDGTFRVSGQYFVGVPEGRGERSGLFDLSVPYDPSGGPSAIAQARGRIIVDLSYFIAREALR